VSRGAAIVAAVAVVVSAGAVVSAGRPNGGHHDHVRQPAVVATSTVTLSCLGGPRDLQTASGVIAMTPGRASGRPRGSLSVVSLHRPAGSPLGRLTAPGGVVSVPLDTRQPPTLVEASGSLAPGATAAQWSPTSGTSGTSGRAASWCQQPQSDWWFVGADTTPGRTSRLLVSNPSAAIAVVDLGFYGPAGKVPTTTTRGIAVAPMSRRSFNLSRIAPGVDALAVNVHADQGEVGAALYSARGHSTHQRHAAWVPATAAPSRDAVVDPAFPGGSEQRLEIANPTDGVALVQAAVVETSGEFTPVGFTDVRIAPGEVRVMNLGSVTHGSAAVQLSSSSPVTAATITERGPATAISAAGHPIDQPAVLPLVSGAGLSLRFVNGQRAGTAVAVATFDAQSRLLATDHVQVTGRAVTGWRLPRRTHAAYVVVDNTGLASGLQGVADYLSHGAITALPVLSGSYTVTRPAVAAIVAYP
jgi:hypothetical protein